MPECVFALLGALVLLEERGTNTEIAAYSGYEMGSINRYKGTMKRLGWVENRSGLLWITERGKIVFAIETGRRTKVRATRKRRYEPMTSANFDRLHANWLQGSRAA